MTNEKYIMALDQGTTSSRCIIFDKNGKPVSKAQLNFKQIYPQNGWVEHDPSEIWESQLKAILSCLNSSNINAAQIEAIGISNQRETTLVWDKKTGLPVCNAIVWQCRRSAKQCEELKEKGLGKLIYEKTGLIPDAYFSATKLGWILENVPSARQKAEKGDLIFGTVDTYLLWKLTNGAVHATDHTNASRTMLFNIHTLKWDDELLRLFNIPKQMLPEVFPSSHLYGHAGENILGEKIPVRGLVGDQQGSLFGQLCFQEGSMKNTYGTGCFMLMNTGEIPVVSKHGLITTLAATLENKPTYALEGSVFVGGAVIQWLRDELQILNNAAESEQIANAVSSSNGVYIVPAFVGLGAPHWNSGARGTITGLTRGTTRAHIIRAALESIAYQVHDVYKAMEQDHGKSVKEFNVDGGASANNFLIQFQSNILNLKITRPRNVESTALGACYLAGLSCGFWKNLDDIRANAAIEKEFVPQMEASEREQMLNGWEKAVKTVL